MADEPSVHEMLRDAEQAEEPGAQKQETEAQLTETCLNSNFLKLMKTEHTHLLQKSLKV